MVERRIKKICMSAMESKFPELIVKDFEVRRTFKFEYKTQDWVDDSYSVFIQVDRNKYCEDYSVWDVQTFLASLFGFEFCIDFFEN